MSYNIDLVQQLPPPNPTKNIRTVLFFVPPSIKEKIKSDLKYKYKYELGLIEHVKEYHGMGREKRSNRHIVLYAQHNYLRNLTIYILVCFNNSFVKRKRSCHFICK